MSTPLTRDELRETLREELNDRFSHFEKRQDVAHEKLMQEVGQIIEGVNSHFTSEIEQVKTTIVDLKGNMDQRFDGMDRRFNAMDLRFDKLEKKVDNKNKEIVDTVSELAERTGNIDLVLT